MRHDLPAGTVTFLFTDVEGSTRLLHELGADAYAAALAAHRRIVRDAVAAHGGVEVDTQGDAFFIAFPTAPGALAAARAATQALAGGPIRVRIGLHTGTPLLTDEGYVGPDVHRGARIAAAGHGGQVLVSSATAQLVDDGDLRDLGLHRLKDLAAPERIFQADPDDHPPLKTLHQTNLPIPATPFLGRDAELRDLATLLADPATRLLTLTGPGGTGKTRLALQAAAEAADHHPDGVWWVPLAPLRDPALVAGETTRALGGTGDPAEVIGDRRMLLLYDNFEHLADAATVVASLLGACPHLRVLVTSREPLRIGGEHEYAVDPLRDDEAVALFTARARAVRHDFVDDGHVPAICARLDHLPLAIELAAARVKLLSPAALLERLEHRLPMLAGGARDAPERQRTLRATIEWSHDLLDPAEQALFARLGVFRGGCTLESAEAVADADLGTLGSLVDQSLVRMRDDRFWMLETIRELAVEKLEASGTAVELRRRHATHFLDVAEAAGPDLMRDDLPTVERLEADHDNLRAALDHFEATGDDERQVRLAGALWRFWYLRSHFVEGRRHLDLAVGHTVADRAAMARARRGASVMALNLGVIDASRAHAEAALALDRELGDEWGQAYALMMIGSCESEAAEEGRDLPAARRHLLEAAALFERIGSRQYGLIARHNATWIAGGMGDLEAERRGHEENVIVAREIGNAPIEADATAQLAMVARDEGRYDDAVAGLREAIRIDRRIGMRLSIANQLGRLASVHAHAGDHAVAARLVGAADAIEHALSAQPAWWAAERNEDTLRRVREELGEERTAALVAEGAALGFDDALALALGEPTASVDPRPTSG